METGQETQNKQRRSKNKTTERVLAHRSTRQSRAEQNHAEQNHAEQSRDSKIRALGASSERASSERASSARTSNERASNDTSLLADHRQRLRAKFLSLDPSALPDYELLEIVLSMIIPRRDVKALAKTLLARFGSFRGIFASDPQSLLEINGLGERSVAFLRVVHELTLRMLKKDFSGENIISSYDQLLSYCLVLMAHEPHEQVRFLTLDISNRIIGEYQHSKGDLKESPIFIRQLIKRALNDNATGMVLIHNHPIGISKPSEHDIMITELIRRAGKTVSIALFDHIIIAKDSVVSFKNLGYL